MKSIIYAELAFVLLFAASPSFGSNIVIETQTELRYAHCRLNSLCDTTKNDFENADAILEFSKDFMTSDSRSDDVVNLTKVDEYMQSTNLHPLSDEILALVTPLLATKGITVARVRYTNVGEFAFVTRTLDELGYMAPPELTGISKAELL